VGGQAAEGGPLQIGVYRDQVVGVGFGRAGSQGQLRKAPPQTLTIPSIFWRSQSAVGADLIIAAAAVELLAQRPSSCDQASLHAKWDVLRFQARVKRAGAASARTASSPANQAVGLSEADHTGNGPGMRRHGRSEPRDPGEAGRDRKPHRGIEALDRRMQPCSKRSLSAAALWSACQWLSPASAGGKSPFIQLRLRPGLS